jgi:hypothetical protein
MNIKDLKNIPIFAATLSSGVSKKHCLRDNIFFQIGGRNNTFELIRLHKKEEGEEFVKWIWINEINDLSNDLEIKFFLQSPEWEWEKVLYRSSFRRSGDLYSDEYVGSSWDDTYEKIKDRDSQKAWRDDSSVWCDDGRPYWWD